MKLTIVILITSICILVAQDAPITPEQRFNLPVGGFKASELVPESVATTSPSEIKRIQRSSERRARNRNQFSTNQPTAKPDDKQEDHWSGGPGDLNAHLFQDGQLILSVQLKTNTVVHWVTVEENADKSLLKQVGTILTNRVALLTHDNGTNEVTMKTLGKGEWPSQVRTVRRAQ